MTKVTSMCNIEFRIALCSRVDGQGMFADDTNLFYSHSNIDTLFKPVNKELN